MRLVESKLPGPDLELTAEKAKNEQNSQFTPGFWKDSGTGCAVCLCMGVCWDHTVTKIIEQLFEKRLVSKFPTPPYAHCSSRQKAESLSPEKVKQNLRTEPRHSSFIQLPEHGQPDSRPPVTVGRLGNVTGPRAASKYINIMALSPNGPSSFRGPMRYPLSDEATFIFF